MPHAVHPCSPLLTFGTLAHLVDMIKLFLSALNCVRCLVGVFADTTEGGARLKAWAQALPWPQVERHMHVHGHSLEAVRS